MRLGLWLACGLILAGLVFGFSAVSWLRGRSAGIRAAEADIARGIPSIREFIGHRSYVTADGYGIDRQTGLPIENTARMCGTGVDLVADAAENAAYNKAIRAAFAAGKLGRFSLNHKVRTAQEIMSLFDAARPTELQDRGVLRSANGAYELLHAQFPWLEDDDPDWHRLELKAQGRETRMLQMFYPRDFAPWPGRGFTPARGPLTAIVVDDDTTLILRDADNYAWVIDLPRGVVVQVVGPIP